MLKWVKIFIVPRNQNGMKSASAEIFLMRNSSRVARVQDCKNVFIEFSSVSGTTRAYEIHAFNSSSLI